MSKKKIVVISLTYLTLIVFVASVVVTSSFYPPNVLRVDNPRRATFASSGQSVNFGQVNGPCKTLRVNGTLEVILRSKFVSSNTIQNFFQTSGYNRGIRVEIDPEGSLGLAVGAATKNGYFSSGLGKVQLDSSFTITLQLRRESMRFRVNEDRFSPWSRTPVLLPQCDSFIVGGGFDGQRPVLAPSKLEINVVEVPQDSIRARLARLASTNVARLTQIVLLILLLDLLLRLNTKGNSNVK